MKQTLFVFSRAASPEDVNGGAGWTVASAGAWAQALGIRSAPVELDDDVRIFGSPTQPPAELDSGIFAMPFGVASDDPSPIEVVEVPGIGEVETRYLPLADLGEDAECRVEGEGDLQRIVGKAIPFGVWSKPIPPFGFKERFLADAVEFEQDTIATFNHNRDLILGRTAAKTLDLSIRATGAFYSIKPSDTQVGRDTVVNVRDRNVVGSSFTFRIPDPKRDQSWKEDETGVWRTIKRARVFEIAPVVNPAYSQTNAALAARSLDDFRAAAVEIPADAFERSVAVDQRARNRNRQRLAEVS